MNMGVSREAVIYWYLAAQPSCREWPSSLHTSQGRLSTQHMHSGTPGVHPSDQLGTLPVLHPDGEDLRNSTHSMQGVSRWKTILASLAFATADPLLDNKEVWVWPSFQNFQQAALMPMAGIHLQPAFKRRLRSCEIAGLATGSGGRTESAGQCQMIDHYNSALQRLRACLAGNHSWNALSDRSQSCNMPFPHSRGT